MNWIDDYKKLLSFRSISTEKEFEPELLACFEWLREQLKGCGFKTERWETGGHPTLFAEWSEAPGKPTLLIYHHYDVQPVDPVDLWNSPPFEPTLVDGEMYARGAQDNKGQLFYTLLALKNLYREKGAYPLNLKLLIEGEEEMGSENLPAVLKKNSDRLKADHLVIVDVGLPDRETPAVTLGVRGLVTFDIEARGSQTDLHSGSHGGLAYNPLLALAEILALAKDPEGQIAIPRFYDNVHPLTEAEKRDLSFEFDEKRYQQEFGIPPTGGESRLSPLERNWLRPTFEINGLWGGYQGEGFKTVIPSKAFAKISCRLVRGQAPEAIGELVTDWIVSQAPPGVSIQARHHPGGGPAVLTDPGSKVVKSFAQAFSEVFNKPCRYILEGASIPIVAALQEASGSEVVLVGLGLGTDQIHAPNEHFGLDRIEKGARIMTRALEILST